MLHFEKIDYNGDKDHLSIEEFRKLIGMEVYNDKNKNTPAQSFKSKYRSTKIEVDGIGFDSEKEAKRYMELHQLEKTGIIKNLELQKRFELIPRQVDDNGHVIERACYYIADFTYERCDGKIIVEDVKSKATQTPQYIIKRKLMLYVYGIRISEYF